MGQMRRRQQGIDKVLRYMVETVAGAARLRPRFRLFQYVIPAGPLDRIIS